MEILLDELVDIKNKMRYVIRKVIENIVGGLTGIRNELSMNKKYVCILLASVMITTACGNYDSKEEGDKRIVYIEEILKDISNDTDSIVSFINTTQLTDTEIDELIYLLENAQNGGYREAYKKVLEMIINSIQHTTQKKLLYILAVLGSKPINTILEQNGEDTSYYLELYFGILKSGITIIEKDTELEEIDKKIKEQEEFFEEVNKILEKYGGDVSKLSKEDMLKIKNLFKKYSIPFF